MADNHCRVSGMQANKLTLIAAIQTAVGAISHITTVLYLCQWRCLVLPDVTGAAIFINRARTIRRVCPNQRTNSSSASPGSEAHSRHVPYVAVTLVPATKHKKRGAAITGRPTLIEFSPQIGHSRDVITRLGLPE